MVSVLLVPYAIPFFLLGLVVGCWWVAALPPAGWLLVWCAFVLSDAPRGDAFNEIYLALGASGAAASAFGVIARKAWASLAGQVL